MSEKSTFQTLSEIDITSQTKEKNKMKYLPWSSAWSLIKTSYPNSTYKPVKTEDGCIYHTDGRTCWVETELNINGEVQNETLAIMDFRNQAIPVDKITSVDVNKSTKRCLVKNAGLFGLGLSLWNGEEISNAAKEKKKEKEKIKEEELKNLQAEIVASAKKLTNGGVDSAAIYAEIEKISGKKNPNSIKDIEMCKNVIKAIEKLKPQKNKIEKEDTNK